MDSYKLGITRRVLLLSCPADSLRDKLLRHEGTFQSLLDTPLSVAEKMLLKRWVGEVRADIDSIVGTGGST